MKIYVGGAHTDVGKSHFSALFCYTFGYSYFKLIQAGSPKDSDFIRNVSAGINIYKAGFTLKTPASPHIGKILEGRDYSALELALPDSQDLIIELAGGILTPLDEKHTMLDYICTRRHPLILVGKYYVGCINHILLSMEALKARRIEVLAIVMMEERQDSHTALTDSFLASRIDVPLLHYGFYDKQNLESSANRLKQEFSFLNITH